MAKVCQIQHPSARSKALRARAAAAAEFVQTQLCFDMDILHHYMARMVSAKVSWDYSVMVSLAALSSAVTARWLKNNLAIRSEFFELPGALFESTDHGITWTQVDNGSFPANTVRVVHDPADQLVSYTLTDHGLFISVDRGVFWIRSALTEAIHGLVFIERMAALEF